MTNATTGIAPAKGLSVGLDLGDRQAAASVMTTEGELMEEVWLKVTEPALQAYFGRMAPSRVVLEAGTHSPWIKRLLLGLGHEVLVLNPYKVRLIAESTNKTDRVDARTLAELGRIGSTVMSTVSHRSKEAQLDLQLLRSRALLVETRTKLIGHVRSAVKTAGGRVRKCDAGYFAKWAQVDMPEEVKEALIPVALEIWNLTEKIKAYEREIARLIAERYRDAQRLLKLPGVGPITALSFVLLLERPERFRSNRQVGRYLGLTPGVRQSSRRRHELGITKAGDRELRKLLTQAAHSIMRCPSADGHLRRWALAKAEGGKGRKKKATVALARKLAVLMLAIWRSGEEYQPFYRREGSAIA